MIINKGRKSELLVGLITLPVDGLIVNESVASRVVTGMYWNQEKAIPKAVIMEIPRRTLIM
jgi:hypothetical protein